MQEKVENVWKKAFESDLEHIISEMNEVLATPSLILLSGPMGVGKTRFVQSFLPDQEVNSPTYSLINETQNSVHADFYRLKNSNEIEYLELEIMFEDKKIILIEWGRQYLDVIMRYTPDSMNFYELDISFSSTPSGDQATSEIPRNYELKKLIF